MANQDEPSKENEKYVTFCKKIYLTLIVYNMSSQNRKNERFPL